MDCFYNMISNHTKIVAISHISNTLGTVNPVEKIIYKAHEFGAKVLIDGAQATTHVNLNMIDLDADYYVFSAHKMYGPTGVGVLPSGSQTVLALGPFDEEHLDKITGHLKLL